MENQFSPVVGLFSFALVLSCKIMFRKRSKTRKEKVLNGKQKKKGKNCCLEHKLYGVVCKIQEFTRKTVSSF